MKNFFFLIAICTGLAFMSCNKDDDGGTPSEFFTASIDGSSFEAGTIVAVADDSFGEELVFMTGTNSDASFTIGLNIPTSIAINTPQTIDANDFGITFTDLAQNAYFTVGTIELSENDLSNNVLEGTFSFTATDDTDPTSEYAVTSGSFRVTYQ